MAYIVGILSDDEVTELSERGWKLETAPRGLCPDEMDKGYQCKMIWVDSDPGLFEELEKQGYQFDYSEYSEPDERDLEIARHASECEACSGDWHRAEKHMEKEEK